MATTIASRSSAMMQNTSIGRVIFLTVRSPRVSILIGTLSRTCSAAPRDM